MQKKLYLLTAFFLIYSSICWPFPQGPLNFPGVVDVPDIDPPPHSAPPRKLPEFEMVSLTLSPLPQGYALSKNFTESTFTPCNLAKRGAFETGAINFQVGQLLPGLGKLYAGVYQDQNAYNGMIKSVYMVGFNRGFFSSTDETGKEYKKIVVAGDLISGKNTFGRRRLGVHYFLTPGISILTGPVWYKDTKINSKAKWALQVDVNFLLFPK